MRGSALIISSMSFVALAGAARAQTLSALYPANIILPNYQRIPVGQEESLEAGAWIARTDDALANWYNPAGLSLAAGTSVNASANSYRGTKVTIEGLETDARSTRVQSVGSFFGGVIRKPLTDSDKWRFGFSITTPLAWEPGLIDVEYPVPGAADPTLVTFTSDVDLSMMIPAVAASFAATPDLRFGAGLGVGITNFDQRQSITLRTAGPDSALNIRRDIASGGMTTNAVFTGGAQWDLSEQFRFGAFAASPGVRITGSSRISYDQTRMTGTSFEDAHFRDPEARFEYATPFRAGAGIAWVGERGAVEVDVHTYGSQDEFDLYQTDLPGYIRTTDPAGVPTTTEVTLAPLTNSWDAVTNVSVGGSWRLTELMRVHAGFGTDQSPVGDETRPLFWNIDLFNATTGISIEGEKFSGSVGLAYSGGSSDPVEVIEPESGNIVESKLSVRSLSLAYALSFKF